MPSAPPKPCAYPGCGLLVQMGQRYCVGHQRQVRQRDDERRGSAAQRGYNSRWRKARESYLKSHPLCAECQRRGHVTQATVVDHIRPHKGDTGQFWDRNNWQPLCKACHDSKTAREDGGWGR